MTRTQLRTSILILSVLVGLMAVPLTAMAASHDDRQPDAAKDGRATGDEKRARHDELVAAKRAAVESFKENRTQIIEAYRATFKAIRESYLENKSRVITDCRAKSDTAADDDNDTSGKSNMSQEDRLAWAHCVRDGLKPLKEAARDEIKEARDAAKAALREKSRAAVNGFHSDKAKIDKRHARAGDSAQTNESTSG